MAKFRAATLSCLLLAFLPAVAGANPQSWSFVTSWGSYGTGAGQFSYPVGVAVSPTNGNVYVTDKFNDRVEVFNSSGAYLSFWGSTGTGAGQFLNPTGVAVDRNGYVYVCDGSNGSQTLPFIPRVQVFTGAGAYVTQWGSYGSAPGQFAIPEYVAVDAGGTVYVTDGWKRVQAFSPTGTYLFAWGTYGAGQGQFQYATGITVGKGGNVYVGELFPPSRVQFFTNTGSYLSEFGTEGTWPGAFNQVGGLAADASGRVYAVDVGNCRVQVFGETGVLITQTGTRGSGNGQFSSPKGIAVDAAGYIYVADAQNNRIQKFAPLLPTPAKALNWGDLRKMYR